MNTAAPPPSEKLRILVVEDEGIIARDMQKRLEELGHTVVGIASSGQDAIELASLFAVDMALMDIRIRGDWDGIETAERLRNLYNVPVIYLTAHADETTLRRAVATEPFGYLLKPFTQSAMTSAIEVALKRVALERKLKQQGAWFSALVRTAGDAILATDCDGAVQFLNPAAESLIGSKAEQVKGQPLTDILQSFGDCSDGEPVRVADIINSPNTQIVSGTLVDQDGKPHCVTASAAPMRDNDKRVFGTVWVIREWPKSAIPQHDFSCSGMRP